MRKDALALQATGNKGESSRQLLSKKRLTKLTLIKQKTWSRPETAKGAIENNVKSSTQVIDWKVAEVEFITNFLL